MKPAPNAPCPCGSRLKYKKCCRRYHQGALASDALTLMKSRYSAYAFEQADYIIRTTHSECSEYNDHTAQWKEEIVAFGRHTEFLGLEIVAWSQKETEAYVHFRAHLSSGILEEKSRFVKESGRWLYAGQEKVEIKR